MQPKYYSLKSKYANLYLQYHSCSQSHYLSQPVSAVYILVYCMLYLTNSWYILEREVNGLLRIRLDRPRETTAESTRILHVLFKEGTWYSPYILVSTEAYRSAGHRFQAFSGNCNRTSITLVTTFAALQMSAKKCCTRAAGWVNNTTFLRPPHNTHIGTWLDVHST